MKALRPLLAAWLAAVVPAAHAYPYCDSPSRGLELYDEQQAMQRVFTGRKFAELDAHFAKVLQSHRDGKVSDAEAAAWFWMFSVSDAKREILHQEWIAAFPKSEAAHLALAYHYVQRGWDGRGSDFGSQTSRTQFEAMARSFERALKALDAAEAVSPSPSIAWGKRLEVLKATEGSEATAALYAKGIRRFPRSVFIRTEYIEGASPHWGGTMENLRRIVEEATPLSAEDRRYLEARVEHQMGMAYEYIAKSNERALPHYERAMVACVGVSASADRAMGIYLRTNDYRGLVRAASRYLERHPVSGRALENRGYAYTQLADYPKGFADYTKASQLGRGYAFDGLAWYYEVGAGGAPKDPRKAIELYTIAHEKGEKGSKAKADRLRASLGAK